MRRTFRNTAATFAMVAATLVATAAPAGAELSAPPPPGVKPNPATVGH